MLIWHDTVTLRFEWAWVSLFGDSNQRLSAVLFFLSTFFQLKTNFICQHLGISGETGCWGAAKVSPSARPPRRGDREHLSGGFFLHGSTHSHRVFSGVTLCQPADRDAPWGDPEPLTHPLNTCQTNLSMAKKRKTNQPNTTEEHKKYIFIISASKVASEPEIGAAKKKKLNVNGEKV